MANNIRLTVDSASAVRGLAAFGAYAIVKLLEASKETAGNIASDAQSRAARASGQTAEAVTVKMVQSSKNVGYRVFTGKTSHPGSLPGWLEFSTQRMRSRPYLFAAARIEEGPHKRRVDQALTDSIDEASR